MAKHSHEVRDPIHGFIQYNSFEREVINSKPFQRLRHIHQLATTNLLYPGATHRRFEHSLGVMHLASQVFDVLTASASLIHLPEEVSESLPDMNDSDERGYWRKVLRMAALCHDIGHLPFSHAAEKELLPPKTKHEHISWSLIQDSIMQEMWNSARIDPLHVAKVAVGKKDAPADVEYSLWETVLAEMVVGDIFGADRMDYLLRDAHHIGVEYGRFDLRRLVNTMRLLHKPLVSDLPDDMSLEPAIGLENGGLQAAESLLWARYLMFSQVYLHHVRRIYDIHLKEFMIAFLDGQKMPITGDKFLDLTDEEVLSAMRLASSDPLAKGHDPAASIMHRKHFKCVFQKTRREEQANPNLMVDVQAAFETEFGVENVRMDEYEKATASGDFPLLMSDGQIISALSESGVLQKLPAASIGFVFVAPGLKEKARKWLKKNRATICNANA